MVLLKNRVGSYPIRTKCQAVQSSDFGTVEIIHKSVK